MYIFVKDDKELFAAVKRFAAQQTDANAKVVNDLLTDRITYAVRLRARPGYKPVVDVFAPSCVIYALTLIEGMRNDMPDRPEASLTVTPF